LQDAGGNANGEIALSQTTQQLFVAPFCAPNTRQGLQMRQWFMVSMAAVAIAGAQVGRAGDLGINVILSGQVAPGVYGQVRLGNTSPPPLVYAQPMLIVPQDAPPPPVYLHVPPDHARNWRKHCREYNACNRPVYFIRSAEYEPDYEQRRHDRQDDHHHDREDDHGHDHERRDDHERHDDREHHDDHERHDDR
jgi:hypothetical protein